LRSNGARQTNFMFLDVVTQIGLGYGFVYLVLGRGLRVQAVVVVSILVGYWLLFALWPVPGLDFDAWSQGIRGDWNQLSGFAAHWNKHVNAAGAFDRWFLNLFPRAKHFGCEPGGYQTLNFIPSMATMILGVMTGELLRGRGELRDKLKRLVLASMACLLLGMALDGHIWPFVHWKWSLCPIVKRIWTPSWVIFSTGWALSILAGFYWLIQIRGWRRWAFPLVVVGMNSITIYIMSWTVKLWVAKTIKIHLGQDIFKGTYGPIVQALAVIVVLWLVCSWMYRKKIFLRI
ncbi:MAG: DUF5009 domain-containing protein, partial [Planctomycetota bacterium]